MNDQRETTLDDLLNEPIIKTVMARDGVRGSDIRQLLERARARREEQLIAAASQASQLQITRGSCHLL